MASHESAIKAHRQSLKRRVRNRVHRSKVRTQVKKMRKALESGDAAAAKAMLVPTVSLLDRSVKHGILHANTAARSKARLTKALTKLGAASRA